MEIEVKISSFIPRIREILKDSSAVYYTDTQIANSCAQPWAKDIACRRLHDLAGDQQLRLCHGDSRSRCYG